jgi:hypothetical protein
MVAKLACVPVYVSKIASMQLLNTGLVLRAQLLCMLEILTAEAQTHMHLFLVTVASCRILHCQSNVSLQSCRICPLYEHPHFLQCVDSQDT